MSVQVLRYSTACRSLCSSCLLPRRTKAYYSQYALSSVAGCIQDPEGSTSGSTSTRARTTAWSNPQHTVVDTKDPLDPTRLDRYLGSIIAADLEPTLDDVERCKPANFSRPDSARYATEYTNLLETLCRSFSKDQLRRFTELYKLDPVWTRSSRRKTEYAESIIEKAWGWPSLKEVDRKRRDTSEVLVKSFTVTPSQLFLIMGKDGTNLLQLSMQYNVHVSLTSSPLSLRIEGLRGSLKGLTEYISTLKKGIIDEIFELPTGRPIRQNLLQRISRLSGAYVENHGNRGKVRMCAKDVNDITTAKRLALCASLEVGTQARTVCYDPPTKITESPIEISEPPRYSLYPFVAPYSFPWTMHPGGTFRLRRVADWLGVTSYEDTASTGGLADNPHRLLNFDQSGEELSQLLCLTMSESTSYRRRTITASLGHILMSSEGKSQLFPSLRGTLSLPEILKWVQASEMPLNFVPSVPPAKMTVIVGQSRVLHRLLYRTLPHIAGQVLQPPQHVLKFEIELSDSPSTNTQTTQDLNNVQRQDVLLSDELNSCADCSSPSVSHPASDPNCQVGKETYVNLMLPDRPMDMQLCVFDWNDIIPAQHPRVLRDYAQRLRHFAINKCQSSQPDPPLTFSFEGRVYYLHESLSLRQSNDPTSLSTILNDSHVDTTVEVCSETITDPQSAQKTEVCQVTFDGTTEGPSWKRFLATCDQLSILSLESRNGKDKLQTII